MLSLFNFPNNLKSLSNALPEDSDGKDFVNEFLDYVMKFKSMDRVTLTKTLKISDEQMERLLNGEQTLDKDMMTKIKGLLGSEIS